jgi:hypothetical protein
MQQSADLRSLDELIVKLGGAGIGVQTAGPCGLLLEHIQAARRDLLGSMRAEYNSSLKFAKESVACIPGKSARAEATGILQGLIDSEARRDHIRSSDQKRSAGGTSEA